MAVGRESIPHPCCLCLGHVPASLHRLWPQPSSCSINTVIYSCVCLIGPNLTWQH